MKEKIKNKKLKESSKIWLQRQLNDKYVDMAKKAGYRSRAAFKLLEIQNKFKIISAKNTLIDLGSAPGGWSQIASKFCRKIIAIDLLDMDLLPNVEFIQGDFTDTEILEKLKKVLIQNKVDVILSDMSPNTCGIKKVDHIRIMNLVEEVFEFAKECLAEDGVLVVKVFQGGTEQNLLCEMKKCFKKINHFKPDSSRKDSSEIYLVAQGFKKLYN